MSAVNFTAHEDLDTHAITEASSAKFSAVDKDLATQAVTETSGAKLQTSPSLHTKVLTRTPLLKLLVPKYQQSARKNL